MSQDNDQDNVSSLQRLNSLLQASSYRSLYEGRSPDMPIEQIFVDLADVEDESSSLIARVLWLEDLEAAQMQAAERESEPSKACHLEILVRLPFEAPSNLLPELQKLALWLSAPLPLGVYGADEATGVWFRHVLLCESPFEQEMLVISALELTAALLEQQAPYFSKVAEGHSAREVLAQIAQHAGGSHV
ncbi:MAG: hypothetical protein AB7I41_12875 [Candidatus Sericytochromatia bacterium]